MNRLPALLARGTKSSISRSAAGSSRAAGMTLPGNGAPVSGSRMTAPPEKSPPRSASESTTMLVVVPLVLRYPS